MVRGLLSRDAAVAPFQSGRIPQLVFGAGVVEQLAERSLQWGRRVLLITGAHSFDQLDERYSIVRLIEHSSLELVEHLRVSGEPSPQQVDAIVEQLQQQPIEVVIAIGGGSVLDAAKCVAGLLPSGDSVMEYLEGVGRGKQHNGQTIPFIAVPTTAGTGSEASMNGVLSDPTAGFKKSFRHPSLTPQIALIDPDMLATLSPEKIAANGCDALSQLLESYLSTVATPFTDSLAEQAIALMGSGLLPLWESQGQDAAARAAVAYGSMISGITLANAGLGVVHGLAGPIGGLYPIPHGVVCGTLLGAANRANVKALLERAPDTVGVKKYGMIGQLMGFCKEGMDQQSCLQRVVDGLIERVDQFEIPRLGAYGIDEQEIPKILHCSDQKANPILLTEKEFGGILRARI
ncbi:MAG: iron-containing alcohol dehydrogenase [Gammaproteobacteria bacterium]|jgi:alcohol dehydrogenase|nr:iron-containing alcohol dehydrogenase [Gammaproteobacteria bacterium]MBT3489500.1 iron-containing alcohol dehydrogenase [Gammaproteobacteria bacterium]MBT3719758.1 iron-containing alcohol dehydrogenase [Gammaproteobacteria bacterium]MBT3844259.1 iron-containing alcohol dehydrogenase [Gammaproteobacteria bacterium]MBT3894061.1 iron-containing alcohol dehydrogenase [Gammaproteobacteria bacterium]